MDPPSRAAGVIGAILAVSLTTGFIVIGRASAAHALLPLDIGLLRIAGASLIAVPWGLWLTRRGGPAHVHRSLLGLSPIPLRPTILTGLAGGTLYCLLCYAGFFFAPAVHASILLPGAQPLWTALLALPLLGERLDSRRLAGLLLIAMGGTAIGAPSLLAAVAGGQAWRGDLLFMAAGICWSAYVVLARRWRIDPVHSTIAITVCALFTYVPLFMFAAVAGVLPSHLLQASPAEILFQMVFQGMFVGVVTGVAFITMVQAFGPVRAGMIISLVPGLSALAAAVFLNEPLAVNAIAGLVFVTAGILLGVWVRPGPRPNPPSFQGNIRSP